ncbi:MAG: histidine kinase dimerization/phospho-acceptor domain-containing protein, partial [Thermomicrobiales bacterium]
MAIAMMGWAAGGIVSERIRLATVAPTIQPTLEGASAAARVFGALVLLLVAGDDPRHRLRWVAGGLMTLGLGGFAFGYVPAEQGATLGVNTQMYASLVVWTVAGACFVFGLVPAVTPPRLTRATAVAAGAACAVAGLALLVLASGDTASLPTLVADANVEAALLRGDVPLPGLSVWYWLSSLVPLALIVVATVGSMSRDETGQMRGWLVIAMTILVGSRVHNLLWPSAFGPILTSANALRFAFALVVVFGGVFELRRLAAERAELLVAERDYSRRLRDLGQVRSDFTAMAAHELGAPIAAISGWADVLATGRLSPDLHDQAIATIRTEVGLLGRLMADVRSVVSAEDDQFAARPVPVPLASLLSEAVAFARVLPGDHPLTWPEAVTLAANEPCDTGADVGTFTGMRAGVMP